MNDITGMNMETEYDWDWGRAQAEDEALEAQEIAEAFERIYLAADELEALYNCSLPDLRADIRFIELSLRRGKNGN